MPPIVVSFECVYFARRGEANFINGGNKLKAMALVASRGRLEHIRGGKYSQEPLWRDVKKNCPIQSNAKEETTSLRSEQFPPVLMPFA